MKTTEDLLIAAELTKTAMLSNRDPESLKNLAIQMKTLNRVLATSQMYTPSQMRALYVKAIAKLEKTDGPKA